MAKNAQMTGGQLVELLRGTIVALVRREEPDLSARQLGIFLICYLEDEPQTVRGLAAALRISKPAVSRSLDRLGEFRLIRRKTDPTSRRSVLVQRTSNGGIFMRDLRGIMREVVATHVASEGGPAVAPQAMVRGPTKHP